MAQQPGYSPPAWYADGNWFWDGIAWNDAVSPDGKWRFDGRDWKAFSGQRTLMPAAPPPPVSAAPPPLMAAPSPEMPSWVAPEELERLENEKRERAAQAAAPQMPLPPELDWRRVGEHMKFSRPARSSSVDVAGIGIYILLAMFCWPAALIYLWRVRWGCGAKVAAIVLTIVVSIVLALVLQGTGVIRPR
jgi:hypothetical protein